VKKVEIVALAITASIMWGASFPVIKIGLENVPPVLFGTLRYVIAVPLFLLLSLVLYGKKLFSIRDDISLFIALGLVGVTMPTVLQNYGMMHTTAYMSSILQSTGPVFTVLLAAYFLKEKLTWYKTAGIIIASAGTYLALDIHFSSLGSSVGNALVLLSAVSYAVGGIIAKTCLNRGYKPVQILMLSSLFGTAVLIVITPFSGNISLGFSAETWGLILFFVYLIPVFATIFSYFMIGERITWLAVLAAAIIITGITIAQTHRNLNAM